jgi:hypothetical protein
MGGVQCKHMMHLWTMLEHMFAKPRPLLNVLGYTCCKWAGFAVYGFLA